MRRLVLILTLAILLTSVLAHAEDEAPPSRGFKFLGQYYELSDCVKTLLVVGGIALFAAAEDLYQGDPLVEDPDAILFVPDDAIPTADDACDPDPYAKWSRPGMRSGDEAVSQRTLVRPTVTERTESRANCDFERRIRYGYGSSGTFYRRQSSYSESYRSGSSYSYSEEHYTYPR